MEETEASEIDLSLKATVSHIKCFGDVAHQWKLETICALLRE